MVVVIVVIVVVVDALGVVVFVVGDEYVQKKWKKR
jgi:hypothetical protein